MDSGESDWADAEGDDGFDDDTINTDDEKESTEQVIPACYDTSILKGSNRITVQPKRKRGRPRKSDQQAVGIDEKKSTQEPTQARASAMEKFDQTIGQPKRKRRRKSKSDRKDGGLDEKESTQEPIQAPDHSFAMEDSDQNNEQRKRKRGRPPKSDRKDVELIRRSLHKNPLRHLLPLWRKAIKR